MLSTTPRRSGSCYTYWNNRNKDYVFYFGDASISSHDVDIFEDENPDLEYVGQADSFTMTPVKNGECEILFDMQYVGQDDNRFDITIRYIDLSIADKTSLIDKYIVGFTTDLKWCVTVDMARDVFTPTVYDINVKKQLLQLGDLINT